MPIITININEKVYDKVLWFLQQFKKSDVEIVDDEFLKTKKELQKDYDDMISGKTKSYSIEEVEKMAEETIGKYENKAGK